MTTAIESFLQSIKIDSSKQSSKLWSDNRTEISNEQFSKVLDSANKTVNFSYEKPSYQDLTSQNTKADYLSNKSADYSFEPKPKGKDAHTAESKLQSEEKPPESNAEQKNEKAELSEEQNACLAKDMLQTYEKQPEQTLLSNNETVSNEKKIDGNNGITNAHSVESSNGKAMSAYNGNNNNAKVASKDIAASDKKIPKDFKVVSKEESAEIIKNLPLNAKEQTVSKNNSKSLTSNETKVANTEMTLPAKEVKNAQPEITLPTKEVKNAQPEITLPIKEVKNAQPEITLPTKEVKNSQTVQTQSGEYAQKIDTNTIEASLPVINKKEQGLYKNTITTKEVKLQDEKEQLANIPVKVPTETKETQSTKGAESIKSENLQTVQTSETVNLKNVKNILNQPLQAESANIAAKNIKAVPNTENNNLNNRENNQPPPQGKLSSGMINIQEAGMNIAKMNFEKSVQFNNVLESQQVKEQPALNQIIDKMKGEFTNGKSEVTIILQPENLGKVDIKLISIRGELTAQITAENKEVLDSINKNIDTLKQNLQDQGVNVGSVSVKIQEPQQTNNNNDNAQYSRNQQNFEGTNNNSTNSNSDNATKEDSELKSERNKNNLSSEIDFNKEMEKDTKIRDSLVKTNLVDYRV